MYDAAIAEGHDARLMRFSPSEDGSIQGKHSSIRNVDYWRIGCLGVTEKCSKSCEESFLKCIEKQNPKKAKDNARAFDTCISKEFKSLEGCNWNCSPTFGTFQ